MGKKASDDPCHEQFVQRLKELMDQFKADHIESSALREALVYVFRAHAEHQRFMSVYWTLIAAHSATLDVIPLLSQSDAAALYALYDKSFKRRDRFPAQTKVLKQLEKAMR